MVTVPDIIITYSPNIVHCPVCATGVKASKLVGHKAVSEGKEAMRQWNKNTEVINKAYRNLKAKKIDAYTFYFEINRAAVRDENWNTRSSFASNAEGKCRKCGAQLQAKVQGTVMTKRLITHETVLSFDDFKGLPLPDDMILSELSMNELLALDGELYNELLALEMNPDLKEPDIKEMDTKEIMRAHDKKRDGEKRLAKFRKKIKEHHAPVRLDYIKAMAKSHPLAELEEFTEETLNRLEGIALAESMKNEYRTFFRESREAVKKTYKKDFARFLTAVERLAARNARAG